ncbi:MAG TPA: outer membrane protein assembly factor BamE [Usitatibacter sp.]|nr:outer membrane protein assembly factor BamE [Usitatibacter sp.]
MRSLAISLISLALAACGFVHKIDVQQGNYVTEDVTAKVKNGMTKAEVRQVLGTPLLVDAFHANRWDYFFSNVKGGRAQDKKRFTVLFENDRVVSFGGTVHPPALPPVGPVPPQPPR